MTNLSDLQHAATPGATPAAPSLELLFTQLTDADPTIRTWAAIGLRKRNDPRAIPALFTAVADADWDMHAEVTIALETLIPPDDVPNLFRLACLPKECAEQTHPNFYAITAYNKLRKKWLPAVNYLASALADPDVAVRERICSNLDEHLEMLSTASSFPFQLVPIPPDAQRRMTKLLLPVLKHGLVDESAVVRAACAHTIYHPHFRKKAIYSVLLPLLKDSDECVRQEAVAVLHRYPRTLSDLQPYLHDKQAYTRAAATQLIPRERLAEETEALIAASVDDAPEVRLAVAGHLSGLFHLMYQYRRERKLIADPRLLQVFNEFLHDADTHVREYAIKQLAEYWRNELAEKYLDALAHGDDAARDAALRVLPDLFQHQCQWRLHVLYPEAGIDGQIAILNFISKLDTFWMKFLVDIVTSALTDPAAIIRRAAVEAAVQVEGTQMREELAPLVNDPSPEVAAAARQALQQIEDRLTFASLAEGLKDPSLEKRRLTISLLEESRDSQRNELICAALHDSHHYARLDALILAEKLADDRIRHELEHVAQYEESQFIRCLAIHSLGQRGTPDMVPLLLPMLREKAHDVRRHAFGALASISGQSFGEDIEAWEKWWASQGEVGK